MIKSVVISLIYFLYFVGFNCNRFSLKWWRFAQEFDLMTWLTSGATHEGHKRSICRKLKSQWISRLISRLGQPVRWLAKCTDSWDFKCDSYTLHPYYIYSYYPQNIKEAIVRGRKIGAHQKRDLGAFQGTFLFG